MKIENNLFVVTGGASGLGEQVVRSIIEMKGYVILIDINMDASTSLVRELGEANVYFPRSVDVTSEAQVEDALSSAVDHFKNHPLCGAILCSGVLLPPFSMEGYGPNKTLTTFQQFKHVIDINLLGTYNMAHKVSQRMIDNKSTNDDGEKGVIISVSSITGLDGALVGYGTSKAAIAGLTLPLARELADYGIRVVCIAPGPFETPILKVTDMKAPLCLFPKRYGHPIEFANTVIHIITSPIYNGSVIRLDGGLRA
ncbi:unnamed protein product [Cunninghamella blakesleeana]